MDRRGFIKYAVGSAAAMAIPNFGCVVGSNATLIAERPEIVKSLEDELAVWEQDVSAGVELRA